MEKQIDAIRDDGSDRQCRCSEAEVSALSRRAFLRRSGLAAAAMVMLQVPTTLLDGRFNPARAAGGDIVSDTLQGLIAFIVPGPDAYSVQQGVSTAEPGGIDATITQVLITDLNDAAPFVPNFSAVVAGTLNQVALAIDPTVSGPFLSPFSNLSFAEKAIVFAVLEGDPAARALFGVLPGVVAFLVYSEAGVFDPSTRQLTATPVGWTISGYAGVTDGFDEFKGYFQNRRSVS